MAPVTGPLTAQKGKERTGCGGKRCGRVRIRKSRLCELLRAVGGGVTRATAAQRLRPRPTCGEITRHHSLANASENSCVTPSVIDSNSPGRPFSLPCHMAPAEWRKPGMPGIGMGKFSTWQKSANQRSTTLVTNTVANTDPCHGTGLKVTALAAPTKGRVARPGNACSLCILTFIAFLLWGRRCRSAGSYGVPV